MPGGREPTSPKVRLDTRADMCADMCTDMGIDMSVDMSVDTRTVMCIDAVNTFAVRACTRGSCVHAHVCVHSRARAQGMHACGHGRVHAHFCTARQFADAHAQQRAHVQSAHEIR